MKTKRIITAFALALALIIAVTAGAEEAVSNISVSEDGILTWDDCASAETWWVGVDGTYTAQKNGVDLRAIIPDPGVYSIQIEGYRNDNSERVACGETVISFDGTHFANGRKSVLAGWWCTTGDHIDSVKVNGAEIGPTTGGALPETGEEITLEVSAVNGWQAESVILRYNDTNNESYPLDGGKASFCAPDAVWMIGINVRRTTPGFNYHDVEFGRVNEGGEMSGHTVNIGIRTGASALDGSRLKIEWTGGNTEAFVCQETPGGNMADPFSLYNFWARPADNVAEGEYVAVLTMYYDVLGDGSAWGEVDSCTFSMTVVKPGTPVNMTGWWCTSGDCVTSFKINGFETDDAEAPQLIPGETARVAITTVQSYKVNSIFLRYVDSNYSDGITVLSDEDGFFEAEFVIPENDFAVGINAGSDGHTYVTVDFDANGGEGEAESFGVRNDVETVLPSCPFGAPEGTEFLGWKLIYTATGNAYGELQPGDTVVFEHGTTLVAMWGTGTQADTVPEPDGTAFGINSETVPADTEAPETAFSRDDVSRSLKTVFVAVAVAGVIIAAAVTAIVLIARKKKK